MRPLSNRLSLLAFAAAVGILGSSIALAVSIAPAVKFLTDDPLWEDPDRELSIPKPTPRDLSKTIDLLQKSFSEPTGGEAHAVNVNTLGEVPDSSWFTNRMGRSVMSIDELVRGPDRGTGPDMSQLWTVVQVKTEGATAGFMIRDARGDLYLIKLDPLYLPEIATATEVIGTKFYHAFGYHAPENYLVRWRPEYLIEPDVDVMWPDGHHGPLNQRFMDEVLEIVPVRPDGTIQVIASKFLPGQPLGPFDYQGTRADDPNDIFLHQDRRELRGLRVFDAWLNHNDSDSVNSLDMFHTDETGTSYVMHYLIDFGTTMGSGASHVKARRAGNEYYIDWIPLFKAGGSFGFWEKPWHKVEYTDYPAVGRFESEYFQPEMWKADYPNPAFDKMTMQDALWATRTVMRFSDEAIRAIVATGRISDPEAEEYLIATLIERRDKIVRFYLSQINPLDGFEVSPATSATGGDSYQLEFENLGVEAGLASGCSYGYAWHQFGNGTGVYQAIGTPGITQAPVVPVPDDSADFLMVKLSSSCPGQESWKSEIDVYLRNGQTPSVVGVERADPPPIAGDQGSSP